MISQDNVIEDSQVDRMNKIVKREFENNDHKILTWPDFSLLINNLGTWSPTLK